MADGELPLWPRYRITSPAWTSVVLGALYIVLGAAGLRYASPMILAVSAALCVALLALSIIDLRSYRLPDAITLPLIAAGPLLAYLLGWGDPLWHIGSAIAGYLLLFAVARAYALLRGRDGLGLGDAKLFAASGAWLGLGALPSVLLWASGLAIVTILFMLLRGQAVSATSRIAFGPFLALGFWIVWLFGPLA